MRRTVLGNSIIAKKANTCSFDFPRTAKSDGNTTRTIKTSFEGTTPKKAGWKRSRRCVSTDFSFSGFAKLLKSGSSDSSPDNKPYISKHDVGISSSYNVIRLFVALGQLYSVINLLRANKLEDYSAYQLTLVPYALMSFINIVSDFVTPSYPAVYMVRSSVMEEAERRGAVFEGGSENSTNSRSYWIA